MSHELIDASEDGADERTPNHAGDELGIPESLAAGVDFGPLASNLAAIEGVLVNNQLPALADHVVNQANNLEFAVSEATHVNHNLPDT